jgi:hypothetical protein
MTICILAAAVTDDNILKTLLLGDSILIRLLFVSLTEVNNLIFLQLEDTSRREHFIGDILLVSSSLWLEIAVLPHHLFGFFD